MHHAALYVSYGAALAGWAVALHFWPRLWPAKRDPTFAHPWREVLWLMVAVLAVLGVGQLYQRGWRFTGPGVLRPLAEAINQILIFSPLLLLLIARGQGLSTAWVPTNRLAHRLVIGVALALPALAVYTIFRSGSDWWGAVVARVYQPRHFGIAVQVFLEDVAIAMAVIRLGAALGRPVLAVIATAALFAVGHIPAMVTDGASTAELLSLVLDFGLAFAALLVVRRSADILWFWCVHYAMDMTQFVAQAAS